VENPEGHEKPGYRCEGVEEAWFFFGLQRNQQEGGQQEYGKPHRNSEWSVSSPQIEAERQTNVQRQE
jgi:hypothetical protein